MSQTPTTIHYVKHLATMPVSESFGITNVRHQTHARATRGLDKHEKICAEIIILKSE